MGSYIFKLYLLLLFVSIELLFANSIRVDNIKKYSLLSINKVSLKQLKNHFRILGNEVGTSLPS